AGGVALSNLTFYSLLIVTPVLLARERGWTHASDIGFALVALSLPTALLAPFGGRLSDRLSRRAPALLGHALLVAAAVPLAIDPTLPVAALIVCLAVTGSAVGLSAATLQTSAVESVPAAEAGSAAGMYSTSRYAGSIVGTIVLGSLISAHGT